MILIISGVPLRSALKQKQKSNLPQSGAKKYQEMKKLLLLLILAATVVLTSPAQTDRKDMSEAAVARLDKAVTLMDNGMAETALEILENLDKEYPNNYTVLYEMCYAHSVMGNLKRVVELCKRLEKHPAADFQVYHMEGNALDNMGKRKEAIKIYNRGLE